MIARTLRRLVLFVGLGLTACSTELPVSANAPPPDPTGWRLSSGKLPTSAEFAALAATCQDKGGEVDPCLIELGLKHTQ